MYALNYLTTHFSLSYEEAAKQARTGSRLQFVARVGVVAQRKAGGLSSPKSTG